MSSTHSDLPTTFSELGLNDDYEVKPQLSCLDGIIIRRDGNQCQVKILGCSDDWIAELVDNSGGSEIMDRIKIKSISNVTVIEEFTADTRGRGQFFGIAEIVSPSLVKLVGIGCPKPILARFAHKDQVKVHDLVLAEYHLMPKEYLIQKICRSETSDYLIERATADVSELGYFSGVRKLGPHERKNILHPELIEPRDILCTNIYWANRYFRDPLVALGRLSEHVQRQNDEVFIVEKKLILPAKKRKSTSGKTRYQFVVMLNKDETARCIKSTHDKSWKQRDDLHIRHSEMVRGEVECSLQVFIGKVKKVRDRTLVHLYVPKESQHLLWCMEKEKERFEKEPFRIGPAGDNCSAASVIEKQFDLFFSSNINMLLDYSERPEGCSIPKFSINDRPLDDSQQSAFECSVTSRGFTTISAPPGSGKTMTISAILAQVAKDDPIARVCVSATTNIAVQNAIETAHEHFPKMTVYRDYSQSSVLGKTLSKATFETSLRENVREMDRSIKKYCHYVLAERKRVWEPSSDLDTEIMLTEKRHKANQAVKNAFVDYTMPVAVGATSSMLTRCIRPSVTRLILDEAGMMSVVDAFAIYCCLPDLTHVTLLGDSKQLKPYCVLNEDSFSYEILKRSELARLENFETVKKRQLSVVYRCHPSIVNHFLRPIYGADLRSGVQESQRSLAADKGFPVAEDKSPFLFIHLEGTTSGGLVNHDEIAAVMKFLAKLRLKYDKFKECYADIAVICHHKAQQSKLNSKFKNARIPIDVQTIDSFQGKEAKIVFVLMTKTARNEQNLQRTLSFVSNWNRETVAVSRAQHAMYLFGDWKGLLQTEFWGQYKTMIKQTGAMVNSVFKPILPDFL